MPAEAPESVVARIFGVRIAAVDDGTSNETLSEWDSMGHMNLILDLESTYGVSLSAEEALEMTSVGRIKQTLRRHGVRWSPKP